MEVAELVLKYIQALAWPAVTVGVAWALRSHIQQAFARMTRLETPAGSIEFATDAREMRREAEELAQPQGAQQEDSATDGNARLGVFQEAWGVADASPIGAVVSAWLVLEEITRTTLQLKDAMPQSRYGREAPPLLTELIPALEGIGLSPRGVSIFNDLRRLRNQAVHGEAVTPAAARDFVETCRYVAREVYGLR
ncbi:hypothetical protein EYS09_09700 [Streptomyces kasugaensis]|uniref:DUF4145 domain-containing protein n=1 Tax=Streptomyces kasugaensis TaxID=1946 RepID=A0A4Q9HXB4_STRKA|nr:hypothetical protein [Streptomyces kasugaensis]TBO59883.1 hypothetical protein EYS09_09700 [Streptomyces kasugaensis]